MSTCAIHIFIKSHVKDQLFQLRKEIPVKGLSTTNNPAPPYVPGSIATALVKRAWSLIRPYPRDGLQPD